MKGKIIFVVVLAMLFMGAGHLLDIGDVLVDAEKYFNCYNGNGLKEDFVARNGFWEISPVKLYHISYYSMYVIFFILVLMYINLLFKK